MLAAHVTTPDHTVVIITPSTAADAFPTPPQRGAIVVVVHRLVDILTWMSPSGHQLTADTPQHVQPYV